MYMKDYLKKLLYQLIFSWHPGCVASTSSFFYQFYFSIRCNRLYFFRTVSLLNSEWIKLTIFNI